MASDHLADSVPRPSVISALCPSGPALNNPPPSADLSVYSCLWVGDQREGQQHHDNRACAHLAAEQVPSKSGHEQAALPWEAGDLLSCWGS